MILNQSFEKSEELNDSIKFLDASASLAIMIKVKVIRNKNGVPWSQTHMRIEMFFGHWQLAIGKFIIGNL